LYCGQKTLVKSQRTEVTARVLACRSWGCPDCNPKRRARLVAEAIGGQPNVFITLTLRKSDPRSRPAQVRALARAWRIVRQRLCRQRGLKSIAFLAVVERTAAGTPHLHILARAPWIDQRWLSNQCAGLLDAPIVWIEAIDQHRGVARYVSKYVGKDPAKFAGSKRYWKSPDYERRPPRAGPIAGDDPIWWSIDNAAIKMVVHRWLSLGYGVEWLSPSHARRTIPPHKLAAIPEEFR